MESGTRIVIVVDSIVNLVMIQVSVWGGPVRVGRVLRGRGRLIHLQVRNIRRPILVN